MILIAESGSTKCDWALIDPTGNQVQGWKTMGFNPYFHDANQVFTVLSQTDGLKDWASKITQVWFYGAGCSSDAKRAVIKTGLDRVFSNSKNHVNHDLMASAYALYDDEPIITCILGTGSNSCFFDGKTLRDEVPSLAYILGDEASASYLGKKLIASYFYKKMPTDLSADFEKTYHATIEDVLENVYKKPNPNVYLAGFGPFAGKHKNHEYIREMVREGIATFIDIHVKCFQESAYVPVSFVGSVAKAFEDIIAEELKKEGLRFGKVLAKPVEALINYHIKHLHILANQPEV